MLNLSFLNNNKLTKINYIFFIFFIFVLSSLVYNNDITAFDKTNVDDFQNSSSKNFKQDYDYRMISYPNSNVTNLTNNNEDSIYGQIESFENNIYVVWQESVSESLPKLNYDIFFIKSEDNGKTFSKAINLSNSTKFSERPQIAVSKNGIFIVWTDTVNSNNKEIIFTKSEDNGKTFSKAINLSNNSLNSHNQEISAFNENVYVVWQEADENNIYESSNSNIKFSSSVDSGNTFKNSKLLTNNTIDAFPKINSYGNNVYIVWNNENKNNSGLFLVKSSDKGNNFDEIIKINVDNNFGESQISVNKNEVLISWGGLLTKNTDNIYYVKSNDNGYTFTDSNTYSKNIIDFNDTNNHFELNDIIKNPLNVEVTSNNNLSTVAWQNSFSKQNEDILILLVSNQKEQNNYARLLNLSNNPSVSECPSITISNNNIYVIWEDYISGNHEILFAKISTEL
ncbi:MAG TPA: sialidase family protein [Nitrososphaeraceae archaeon]|nr:sialidase family protein [Nitrososphaeraceae archaeon]